MCPARLVRLIPQDDHLLELLSSSRPLSSDIPPAVIDDLRDLAVPPKKRTPSALPRLQRFLSECGVASRRSAEELIAAGKVTVNDIVVTELGTRIDPAKSIVRVSRRIVTPAPKGVLLLHKPPGVVSTLSDPEGRRSIADYLTKHYRSYFPVGRLDWDSAGLVILTNDGDLANHLLHPRFEVERVYHARVEGLPTQRTLEMLAKGVKLTDGPASCRASIVERSGDHTWVEVTISEGRNRIVRRLFDFVGHPVDKLKRISHGPFRLGNLRPGDVRRLTEREYSRLKGIVLAGGGRRRDEGQDSTQRRAGRSSNRTERRNSEKPGLSRPRQRGATTKQGERSHGTWRPSVPSPEQRRDSGWEQARGISSGRVNPRRGEGATERRPGGRGEGRQPSGQFRSVGRSRRLSEEQGRQEQRQGERREQPIGPSRGNTHRRPQGVRRQSVASHRDPLRDGFAGSSKRPPSRLPRNPSSPSRTPRKRQSK